MSDTVVISPGTMLVGVLSYNQVNELEVCLKSLFEMCPGFPVVVVDDASTDRRTLKILRSYQPRFKHLRLLSPREKVRTRGRLHENMEWIYQYALQHQYRYVFFVQDDMQFLRPLDEAVCCEYTCLFQQDPRIIQVDPRFPRRTGTLVIDNILHSYRYTDDDYRNGFSDVGITHIPRLQAVGWRFEKGEGHLKQWAFDLGLKRVFPFTPLMMHVPYPRLFRRGKRVRRIQCLLYRRGSYRYHTLTPAEREMLDTRPLSQIPFAKDVLRPKGMHLSYLRYRWEDEHTIFS